MKTTAERIASFVFLVLLFAAFNRLRGDGQWLPAIGFHGRALFYVTVMVAATGTMIFRSWKIGAALGLAYLMWGVGPWGRWFDLGRLPDGYAREGIPMSWYESIVWTLSGHWDHAAMFIRHLNILPGFLLLGWLMQKPRLWLWSPLFSFAIVCAYEIAWRYAPPPDPIGYAEVLAGCIWGVTVWALWNHYKPQSSTVS